METPDLKKVLTDAQRNAATLFDQAREGTEEERRRKVERAAAIVTMLETEGGKEMLAEIEKNRDVVLYAPEAYFMEMPDGQQVVNATMVARAAGMREGLGMLTAWFGACRKLVEQEAKKSAQAEDRV